MSSSQTKLTKMLTVIVHTWIITDLYPKANPEITLVVVVVLHEWTTPRCCLQEASLVWERKEAILPLISKTDREKVHSESSQPIADPKVKISQHHSIKFLIILYVSINDVCIKVVVLQISISGQYGRQWTHQLQWWKLSVQILIGIFPIGRSIF